MTKLEYGDLYKFLASLGIVLISLALLVPWLLVRESFGGLLTPSDVSQLTPMGQALLHYRQQLAVWFLRSVWCISPVLAVSGTAALVLGILPWVRRQRIADEREQAEAGKANLEYEKLRREMQALTPVQIALKGIEETAQEVPGEVAADPAAIRSVSTGLQEYLRVQQMVFDKLVTCYGQERILTQQSARGATYDAVLLADCASAPDVVFEVKRLTRRLSLDRLRAAVDQTSALIQNYAVLRARLTATVVGIVMFVVPEHDRDSAGMEEYLWAAKDQADLYGVKVHPIFITEKELREIRCSELRAKIERIGAIIE